MKVLHIVKTAVGANWAYEQVRVLCSLGIEVVVALPSDTEGLAPKYRQAGAAVLRANLDFPARKPWRVPATLRACRQLVADVRPDLIHTHHVGPTFITRLALGKNSKIPRVFGVTGTLHLEHDFFAWLDTHLAGPQDCWVATCKWTQRKYETLGIPSNRVFLAYLGTELKNYPAKRTGILRNEFKIPSDVPLVGMVSLLYPPKWYLGSSRGHKGHEDFIVALARMREVRPDVRGIMIGGTWGHRRWYEDRVRYFGKRLCNGGLQFSPTRSDLSAVYPDLDLAVVPTLSDGLPYSVVEPLLAGVPVVATNVGGIPDLIRDGDTGWLVSPGNPEALGQAALDVLSNPAEAQRRTARGQQAARDLLDLEKTGRELAAIYETILEPAKSTKPALLSRPRVRILHVVGSMDPGGIEVWLLNVLKYIDKDFLEFHFCTFGPQPGLFADEVERLGGRILPCPRGTNPWSFARRFRQILREGKYDAVHSHVTLFSGAVLRWAHAEGVPMRVAHSHTSQDDRSNGPVRHLYRRVMKSWINRYATCGLGASTPAAADLFGRNWRADTRFRILHYGIDLRPFEVPIQRDKIREELGIPLSVPVVGHVGRFIAAKNHVFLVEIAKEIQRRRPETHFLFVGDGPLKRKVEAQANKLDFSDKLHFVGTRIDVPQLMLGGMDVFLFPSLWEGLPVALIEAQAAGLRCIVSESVANEADILPEQIRLSLSKSYAVWAEKTIEALTQGRVESEFAINAISHTDFCAQRSTFFLSELYQKAVGGYEHAIL